MGKMVGTMTVMLVNRNVSCIQDGVYCNNNICECRLYSRWLNAMMTLVVG